MLYERRVKVKLDLTLQQPFTNVVITLCASWDIRVLSKRIKRGYGPKKFFSPF